jgi:hypothetical protein
MVVIFSGFVVASFNPFLGPQKPGVQVIQAKQKIAKAVGAAALPPNPLNTPSLKRETASSLSYSTTYSSREGGGGAQSNDEASPSLKGIPAAKPAPWAKPSTSSTTSGNSGNNGSNVGTPVTNPLEGTDSGKTEDQPSRFDLSTSSSKQAAKRWANADDSEEEDHDDGREAKWPDNFRENADESPMLPPAAALSDHDPYRYVPPSHRSNMVSVDSCVCVVCILLHLFTLFDSLKLLKLFVIVICRVSVFDMLWI